MLFETNEGYSRLIRQAFKTAFASKSILTDGHSLPHGLLKGAANAA